MLHKYCYWTDFPKYFPSFLLNVLYFSSLCRRLFSIEMLSFVKCLNLSLLSFFHWKPRHIEKDLGQLLFWMRCECRQILHVRGSHTALFLMRWIADELNCWPGKIDSHNLSFYPKRYGSMSWQWLQYKNRWLHLVHTYS